MCGIAGLSHFTSAIPIDESRLIAMRDAMHHRGPDDGGHYLAPGIALASRRLAILDLSERGHMPMSTQDGRFWIVYNGEVYNFQTLRADLEGRGCRFVSNTDTEVLLQLYAQDGPAMLKRLNGMFAFAIWDSRERTLFLARDRLGVKPLYYSIRDGILYFASEAKALFTAGLCPEFDHGTWEELICFRYVAGERTPFVGVHRLLPGHHLTWKEGVMRVERWWNLAERALELREDLDRDPAEWFRETFDDAVNLRRISDVPVGVLLSGGLDSSSVAASLAMQAGKGVESFTVCFDEPSYNEGPLARQVADQWSLRPHELTVTAEGLPALFAEAVWLNDEPLAHLNEPHMLAISRDAKPRVTVLLAGEGSDEILGGYVRYRPLKNPELLRRLRGLVGPLARIWRGEKRLAKLHRHLLLASVDEMILHNGCDVLPGELEALGMQTVDRYPYRNRILAESRTLYPDNHVRQAMYLDQHTFLVSLLDRMDRMTMGASIECRLPFLDYRLVEGAAALPWNCLSSRFVTKPLLRRSIGNRLPEVVRRHYKWGFGVPWGKYLRATPALRAIVEQLADREPLCDGPFDPRRLRTIIGDFLKGDDRFTALVLRLFVIAQWYQAYFQERFHETGLAPTSSAPLFPTQPT